MHKLFLNPIECSIIKNSETIEKDFGGFPAMENAEICSISLRRSKSSAGRYDCSIVFGVEEWGRMYAAEGKKPTIKNITLDFIGCLDVYVSGDVFLHPGEIKFGTNPDPRSMHQDLLPGEAPITERPYCTFYICTGSDFRILFDEESCIIQASAERDAE